MPPLSWLTFATAILGSAGLGGLIKAWWDHSLKKSANDDAVAIGLVHTLSARVDKLEAELLSQRDYYEQKIDRLQATYDASQRVSRHELANVKMRFKALIMLLKRLPDPPPMLLAILDDIEAMEADQARAEAAEKGAQAGARIAAAAGADDRGARAA